MRPWTAARAGRVRGQPPGFNGATALRPWTDVQVRCASCRRVVLQWGHGLAAVDGGQRSRRCRRLGGFNGATALRPWTALVSSAFATRSISFNGATALRPWTAVAGGATSTWTLLLQWGHGLAAVDGASNEGYVLHNEVASMGPRPCGRGRRDDAPDKGRAALGASMGPRPCGRGRNGFADGKKEGLKLQWGHGLAAVDGEYGGIDKVPENSASMGPRPCGRGRRRRLCGPCVRWLRASMGPRPCGRGRREGPA